MTNHKDYTSERFGNFADEYVSSPVHAKGKELSQLVKLANPEKDWHVLDIATGGGHTALTFAPHVAHVTATDISPDMLQAAEKYILSQGVKNVDFQIVDAEDLPFEDQQFDLVTCRIAAHHFPNVQQFISEAARVLKTGGKLLVQDQVVPNDLETARYLNAFEKLRDPSHYRVLSLKEWEQGYQAAGITPLHNEEIITVHQLLAWAKRQDNDAETIATLQTLLANAPKAVAQWMQGKNIGTEDASFVIHHVIVLGVKN